MTRRRSSPLGLELVMSAMLVFMLLPLLTQAAPLQDMTEIQQYTEGCYYNYNHYNEGDRILTNEPCLNCTCHNKMLMCYLRVCPFTKPIGHDCVVEKREDQCCPIITCPEVPVDVAHHTPEPGTELSIPEKYGCSIDERFYPEGAQVPSNPNKPCELCYCIKNRTSCLMQECTLHIDGCQPIYNKGSCCPVRYNCDHENDVLELEDHSTSTTTTVRPTTGFILTTTMTPAVSTDCIHNGDVYADGASLLGRNPCDHCYCMRGDIVCAVQECEMPMLAGNGKSCHPLPASEGECCPSNYVCEDDATTTTTDISDDTTLSYIEEEVKLTTTTPIKDLHSSVSVEDLQLQKHIDDDGQMSTVAPEKMAQSKPTVEDKISGDDLGVTTSPVLADADRKQDEISATTVSDVTDEDKTPSLHTDENISTTTTKISDEETSSAHEKDEATTAMDFAPETITEKSEEEIEESGDKTETKTENVPKVDTKEEEDTILDQSSEKLSHSDDVTMNPDLNTEQSEIEDDKEDEADVSSDKPIEGEEFTTEKIVTRKEEKIPAIENEYISSTTEKATVSVDIDVTTMRTDSTESDDKIGTTSSRPADIPLKSEQATEHAENIDFTPSKTTDGDVESQTEVPKDENVEIVTAQPAFEGITDHAQEGEEGSGFDKEDFETKTTPAVLSDETHLLDDKETGTATTQKTPSVADRKEDSESATEVMSSEMESIKTSTSKPTEDEHEQTTTADENLKKPEDQQATIDLNAIKKIEEESIADHTTTLQPTLFDYTTTSTDSNRFDVSHKPQSTEASTAADYSADKHTTPAETGATDMPTKAEYPQSESVDIDADKDHDMIDQTTEVATDSYPSSSIASMPEQHEDELTTISSIDIHTSTEHPSRTDIVPPSTSTTVPDKATSDIEQTTQSLTSTDDVTSDKVYDMEIIPTAIPGEGDCLVGQKTYQHNSVVPSSGECDNFCRCLSSIVVCQPVQCQIPKNIEKCTLDETSADNCCPAYICESESSPEKPDSIDAITEVNEEVQKGSISSTETILMPVDKNDEVLSSGLPTDIDMPIISTEEPMSHIKNESNDEKIASTTNIPNVDTATFATESPEPLETVSTHDKEKPVEIIDRKDVTSTTPVSGETIKPDTADTISSQKPADEQSMTIPDDVSETTPVSEESMKPHEADKTKPADEQTVAPSTISPSSADMSTISNIDDSIPESEDSITKSTVSPDQVHPSSMTEKPDDAVKEGSGYFTSTPSTQTEKLDSTDDSVHQGTIDSEDETATSTSEDKEQHSTEQTITPPHETGDESMPDTLSTSPSSETDVEKELSTSAPIFDDSLFEDKDKKIMTPATETVNDFADETLSHTLPPLTENKYDDAIDESTHAPTVHDKPEITDEHSAQTIATSTEADVIITTTSAPMVEDDIENIDLPHKIAEPTDTEKEAPAEDFLIPTTAATIGDESIDDKLTVTTSSNEDDASEVEGEPIDKTLPHTSVPEDQTNASIATEPMQTIAPSTEDKETSYVTMPHTTLSSMEGEKDSTTENSLPQTSVPSTVGKDGSEYIQKIPPRTVVPIVADRTESYDDTHTSTPTTIDKVKASAESDIFDENLVQISTPSEEDKAGETTDESLLQTSAPTEDDKEQSLPPLVEDKTEGAVDETLLQTVSPAVDANKQQIDDEDSTDETLSHTIAPTQESDITPIDDKDMIDETVDETLTQTVAPAVDSDKKQIDDEYENIGTIHETLSPTVAPTVDSNMEQIDEEDKKADSDDETVSHTVVPAVESDNEAIGTEDKKADTVDETLSHTVAPEVDESLSHTVAPDVDEIIKPIEAQDKNDDASVPHTVAPDLDIDMKPIGDEDKEVNEPLAHTVAPHVDKDVKPIDNEEDKVDESLSHTVAPTVDSDKKTIGDELNKTETLDETLSHTVAPTLDNEKKIIDGDKKTTDSPLHHTVIPSTEVDESLLPTVLPAVLDEGEEHKKPMDDIQSQTIAPSSDDTEKDNVDTVTDHVTVAGDEYLEHITTPTIENKYDSIDKTTAQSTAPSRGDEKPVDTSLSHTIAPVVEGEKDTDEQLPHTVAPTRENDKVTSDYDNDKSVHTEHAAVPADLVPDTTVSTTDEEMNKIKESHVTTSAPSEETEKESTENTTSSRIVGDKDDGVHPSDIGSPADAERNETIDDNLTPTSAPSASDKIEETINESMTTTVIPSDEFSKKPIEEQVTDEFMQQFHAPALDDEKKIIEDTSSAVTVPTQEQVTDEFMQHTHAPALDDEKKINEDTSSIVTVPTLEQATDEFIQHTHAPALDDEKKIIEDTSSTVTVPTQDTKTESGAEPMHSTVAPLNYDSIAHNSIPVDEDIKKTTDGSLIVTVPPLYEGMTEATVGDSLEHTIAPVLESEKDTKDDTVSYTVSPLSDVTSQENVSESLIEIATTDKYDEEVSVPSHTISPQDAEEEIKDSNAETTDSSVEDEKKHITITPIVETDKPTLSQNVDDVADHTSTSEVVEAVTVSVVAPEHVSEVGIDDETMTHSTPSIEEEEVKKEHFDGAMSQTVGPIVEEVEKETIEDSMEHTVAPTASLDKEPESELNSAHPSIDTSVHKEDKKHLDKLPTESELPATDGYDSTTPSSAVQDKESHTEIGNVESYTNQTVASSAVTPISDEKETSEHTVSSHITEHSAVTDGVTSEPHKIKETDDKDTTINIPSVIEKEQEKEMTTPIISGDDEIHRIDEVESTPSTSTKKPIDEISETTAHGAIEGSSTTDTIPTYNEDEGQKVLDVTFAPISQDEEQSTSTSPPAKEQDSTTAGTVSAKPDDETITVVPTSDESDLHTYVPPKEENITVVPSVVADLDSTEETEDSVESEEEITTDPNAHKSQHIGQFVTDRVEEASTANPTKEIHDTKHDELETSSEEDSEEQTASDEKEEVPDITTSHPLVQSTSSTPVLDVAEGDIKQESTEKPSSYLEDQDNVEITQIMPVSSTSKPHALHVDIETTTIKHDASEAPVNKEDTTAQNLEETDDSSEKSDEEKEAETEIPATTSMHPILPHLAITTTSEPISETGADHKTSAAANESTSKATEKPTPTTTTTTTTTSTTTSEAPISTSTPSTQYSQPPPSYGGQPPQYPSYPEDEYTDEDETEVFGPGTCRYGGKLFVSAQQIPRDDPCDFCFCFRSDIICLQQSCPPPISGCHEEPISGFCCPRYECPVSMATVLNITTSTTTTSTTLPPHFLHHAYGGSAEKNGCHINGKSYRVGENIDSTSGPCMHCTCGGDGQMKCDPKTCSPEPMLRQMIAVVASRRR